MNQKISTKTLAILVLFAIAMLLFLVPFEVLLGKPAILGAVISKVFVKGLAGNYTCNLNLETGWNLISFGCKSTNNSVISVLGPVQNNYTSIHTYVTTEPIDNWKSYNPSMPAWVIQDLTTIDQKKGYWISMVNDSFLQINGTKLFPDSIPLSAGWNLIGYPDDAPEIPATAFASISGQYSIVWAYNTTSSTYQYYNPALGNGTLQIVDIQRGYWLNMSSGGTLWVT